jgi:hypothetical protein
MKTFYFILKETQNKYVKAHRDVSVDIYKIVKNKPIFLCTHSYNSGSCMGTESEVFRGLFKNNLIPKKYEGKYSFEIPYKAIKL